jgi:hypothetical protein
MLLMLTLLVLYRYSVIRTFHNVKMTDLDHTPKSILCKLLNQDVGIDNENIMAAIIGI